MEALVNPCVHRWIIPPADGSPLLTGTCAYCGATRTFDITPPDARRYNSWKPRANAMARAAMDAHAEYEREALKLVKG